MEEERYNTRGGRGVFLGHFHTTAFGVEINLTSELFLVHVKAHTDNGE